MKVRSHPPALACPCWTRRDAGVVTAALKILLAGCTPRQPVGMAKA